MKAALLAIGLALHSVPGSALAEDNHTALTLRSKAAIATAVPPTHRYAPYVEALGEPPQERLFTTRDPRQQQSRSSCESSRDLCYDNNSGRIVYKPARQFMPGIPGLQADSISVKRDKIVFKYTF
jgi:hypothetical protein